MSMRKYPKANGKFPTFITGSGRCGTQTVAQLLGCTHEANREHFVKGWWDNKGVYDPPWGRNSQHKVKWLTNHLTGVSESGHGWYDCYDSNNIYIHFLWELYYVFGDDVRIIYLTRHPFGFVSSALARKCDKGNIFGMHPHPTDDPLAWAFWEHWTPVQQCAWIWLKRNTIAHNTLNAYQMPHWQGQIEQLYNPGVIEVLENWTGLVADPTFAQNKTKLHQAPNKEPLSWHDLDRIATITQPMGETLGYSFDDQTKEHYARG